MAALSSLSTATAEADLRGAYGGLESGAVEHHFYLQPSQGKGREFTATGLGGGGFIGYDKVLGPRLSLGGELGLALGGGAPIARFPGGLRYATTPRWGYQATARLGYRLGDRWAMFGAVGWGGYRYDIDNTAGVTDADAWNGSFVLGAGLQRRLSNRVSLRLEARHLDNSANSLLIGLPIRF